METTLAPDSQVHSRSASQAWRWVAAAAIFGCIGLNYWWNTNPANGQNMGQVSAQYPTPLTPSGWAFSIWGLIFLSEAIYAVWQLLPAQRSNPLPNAVARPLTVANLAAAAWVVCFSYELIAVCTALMLLTLGALVLAYGRARRLVLAGETAKLSSWPVSLFMGWISVATVVNLTLALRDFGWETPMNVTVVLCVALLAVVVALGLIISSSFRDAVYPLVLAWGLIGIWAARRADLVELAWVALAGAVVVGLLGVLLANRRRSTSRVGA
ncbi:tryptophan-rich sensory protein [Solirubrum puertoriconensis]|uniref:Tryptophan-rich sensory protein n=1 Tax=Solirubrum puertoriconensis TaxID=1751427 RepID=A0A9X0L3C3_SOLP1|nr:tryptophan-rich sensory protein [Solirubrum puertoriconensis]KUG06336.1 hypothetical protein ASU33_02980 [Solirubrum puertoriconensis]